MTIHPPRAAIYVAALELRGNGVQPKSCRDNVWTHFSLVLEEDGVTPQPTPIHLDVRKTTHRRMVLVALGTPSRAKFGKVNRS